MKTHALRLMYREATDRLADAAVLKASRQGSTGYYFLDLLALELLLKFVLLTTVPHAAARGHSYDRIFSNLPPQLQSDLLSVAGERIGPSELKEHESVLRDWSKNFVELRYPYEKYVDDTAEEYRQRGNDWIAAGAPLDQATFRFHPEELLGMLHALKLEAERRLADLPEQ